MLNEFNKTMATFCRLHRPTLSVYINDLTGGPLLDIHERLQRVGSEDFEWPFWSCETLKLPILSHFGSNQQRFNIY